MGFDLERWTGRKDLCPSFGSRLFRGDARVGVDLSAAQHVAEHDEKQQQRAAFRQPTLISLLPHRSSMGCWLDSSMTHG